MNATLLKTVIRSLVTKMTYETTGEFKLTNFTCGDFSGKLDVGSVEITWERKNVAFNITDGDVNAAGDLKLKIRLFGVNFKSSTTKFGIENIVLDSFSDLKEFALSIPGFVDMFDACMNRDGKPGGTIA